MQFTWPIVAALACFAAVIVLAAIVAYSSSTAVEVGSDGSAIRLTGTRGTPGIDRVALFTGQHVGRPS
jgi:hypothetical protein